jgi:hypothetical protein
MTTGAVSLSGNQRGFRLEVVDEHRKALQLGDGVIEPVSMNLHTCQI